MKLTREELAEEISKGLIATGKEKEANQLPLLYVEWLEEVKTLVNPRCFIYAGMWCTFSQLLCANFLIKQEKRGKDLNSLRTIYEIFKEEFAYEILLDERQAEFEKRARDFLDYVGDLDLAKYGVEEYDKASEWI